ncbi:MAG: hypothetical protein M0R03_21075 [Novosphingobium sp.]|jgi:hypothetical protein|nr:hypothetical protein [Novosphingobium sp.]
MANLKAKLKRTLEPAGSMVYPASRTDTLLDLTEPINGWVMNNAIILVDFTVMAFMEGNISGSGAVRCSYTIILEGSGDGYDGYISAQSFTSGADYCRYWPSCAVNWLMEFPRLTAFGTIQGGPLYPGAGRLDLNNNRPELLQITYSPGNPAAITPPQPIGYLPTRFYISADIMIFETDES